MKKFIINFFITCLPRDEIFLQENFILRGGVDGNRTHVHYCSLKIIYKLSLFNFTEASGNK